MPEKMVGRRSARGVCQKGFFVDVRGVQGERTADAGLGMQNAGGEDAGAGLCGAVGGAEAGEDDGGDAAHGAEEGLEECC